MERATAIACPSPVVARRRKRSGLGGHAAFITVALTLITGIAHAAPLAYLTMGGNLWIVDTATNTVRAVVPGADGPGVAISPSGARVYVTNQTDASVSVFDATANRLLAKVPLSETGAERRARAEDGSRTPTPSSPGGTATPTLIPPKAIGSEPVGIAVDPSGGKVFIAAVGEVLVLDTASNEIVQSIPLPLENGRELLSEGIAVSPDGTRLYVVTHSVLNVGPYGVNLLAVIDPQAGETIATIPLSGTPVGVAVHRDGHSIFVSTNLYMSPFESHGGVLIIDAATGTVVDTVISPGGIIGAIALSADGSRLYASGDFFAMDIATRALVLRGPDTGTFDISVTPDGKMAYLPRFNTVPFRMAVVDTATGAVRTTVQLGCNARAFGLFIGPSSGPPASPIPTPSASYPLVYVVNSYSDSVTAAYVGSGALFDSIEVGFEPQGVAVCRDGRHAVVTNWGGHSISLIDTVRRVAMAGIQVGERPVDVVVAPDGSTAYVALLSRPGGVDVVDLDARRVRTTLPLGPTARLAISPDGRRLYAANGDVSVIDTASDATLATLPTVAAGALSVSPDGATLYASTTSSVLAIDIASMQSATMLPTGGIDIAVTPDGQRLLVSIDRSEGVTQRGGVMLIDTATGALLTEIPTASVPDRIAISSDGQLAYVVMINGTAAIIDLAETDTVGLLPTGCSARGIAIAPVSIQPMPARCAGDCDADGVVTVDELVRAVGVALGKTFLDACTALDANVDRSPDVSELVTAVGNALNGCAAEPPLTPTLTPTITPTPTLASAATPTSELDECANVCDSLHQCAHPAPCGDTPYFGSGICRSGGPGPAPGECRCRPFECNYCDIQLDAVPSEVDGATVTISGDAKGYNNGVVSFEVRGGEQPAFAGSYSVFSIEVPLNPGENQLTVISRAQGPPACWNEYGPFAVSAPNPRPPRPTLMPHPCERVGGCCNFYGVRSCYNVMSAAAVANCSEHGGSCLADSGVFCNATTGRCEER